MNIDAVLFICLGLYVLYLVYLTVKRVKLWIKEKIELYKLRREK
jgi:hypothetical protein